LVLGATGLVGRIAVQAAKLLGAGRVIAAGRGGDRLRRVRQLGADVTVDLQSEDDLAAAFRKAAGDGVDVIVDPLWGPPALAAIQAAAYGARLVQIGQLAGAEIGLPAPLVRSAFLAILGYANFHAPLEMRRGAYMRMAQYAAEGRLTVDAERLPLREVQTAWTRQHAGVDNKLILIP
jgi:NADPH:quinone reductase-like Zn-dependent oxidoreductase